MNPVNFITFLRETRPSSDNAYEPFIITPTFDVAIVPYKGETSYAVYFYTLKKYIDRKDFTMCIDVCEDWLCVRQYWTKFNVSSVFTKHNAFNFYYWRDYFLLCGRRTSSFCDPAYYFGRLAP